MPTDVPVFVLALAGLGVGFVVGLTGMGGGALMTPVLVLLFGIDPSKAVGSDLVVSLLMKPVGGGVHLRKGTVNLELVKWLVIGSVPSAFLSVWVFSRLFGDNLNSVIQYAIGVALLIASAGLIAKGAFSGRRGGDDGLAEVIVKPFPTLLIGIFGGVAVGITSVGCPASCCSSCSVVSPKRAWRSPAPPTQSTRLAEPGSACDRLASLRRGAWRRRRLAHPAAPRSTTDVVGRPHPWARAEDGSPLTGCSRLRAGAGRRARC